AAVASPIDTGAGATYIGRLGTGVSYWMNGQLDDVAVYGSALSAAQVNTHYTRATDGGLTLSTGSQYAYVSIWPRDLYFNYAQSGSFTVTGNIADAESGMQKINFPAVSTMTGGGDDTTSPYSATY